MKRSQIDTENDKSDKFSNFNRFYAFFSKFSTDIVNWNVEKGQQGRSVFSSMLGKKINAVFQTNTVRNNMGKDKFRKFSKFHYFGSNFVQVSIDFVD